MTTFRPKVVKCVARHLFAFPRLSPHSCVRLFLRSLVSSVCVHLATGAKPPIFQPWFPPRAKPVRVSNIVICRHTCSFFMGQ